MNAPHRMESSREAEATPGSPALEEQRADGVLDEILRDPRTHEAQGDIRQRYGVVASIDGARLLVRVEGRVITATRAASCLLAADVGDRVLVALDPSADDAFVLAVLTHASKAHAIAVEGDLALRATGAVDLVGQTSVSVVSAGEASVSAPETTVRTLRASFFAESLSYVGRRIDAEVDKIKAAAQVVDSVFDRVTARLKSSHRTIEEVDTVRAGAVDVVVRGNASTHAENVLTSAEKLVKLDGEQVHIG